MLRLKLQHVNKRGPWYLNFIRSFQLFWLNNTWQSSLTAHISNEILSNTRSQIMNRYGIEWKKWLPFSRQYFQMRFLEGKCWLGAGHVTSHFLNQCWPWFLTSQKHDDIIKWKHFLRNCSFVQGIHWSSVNSPHKGQWRGALTFSLICAWINGWVNYCDAGDLRCHFAHYDVTVMMFWAPHRKGSFPDSKVHEANMGPTWVLSAPDGSHVGPMNLAISVVTDVSGHSVWYWLQGQ